jgi:hypothetical protein
MNSTDKIRFSRISVKLNSCRQRNVSTRSTTTFCLLFDGKLIRRFTLLSHKNNCTIVEIIKRTSIIFHSIFIFTLFHSLQLHKLREFLRRRHFAIFSMVIGRNPKYTTKCHKILLKCAYRFIYFAFKLVNKSANVKKIFVNR